MHKPAVFIITCLILLLTISGCSQKKHNIQPSAGLNNGSKITMSDIEKNYTGGEKGQIINKTNYGQYVLVEWKAQEGQSSFDWYNLTTGDRDTLPIGPYNSKLLKIKSENDIQFITDGICILNGHKYFPQIIECLRGQEVTGYNGEFYSRGEKAYLKIDQGAEFGVKSDETVSDIKVSLNGIDVFFQQGSNKNSDFYAGYTTIPHTKTSYLDNKNQLVVIFENTTILPQVLKQQGNFVEQNNYISSIDPKQNGKDIELIINLKENAKFYTANLGHVEPDMDDFPYLSIQFISKALDN